MNWNDRSFDVRFRDAKVSNRPCKSFWVKRPGTASSIGKRIRWERRHGTIWNRSLQDRESYPYYYECLLLSLFKFSEWRPGDIKFDIEPTRRQSSYCRQHVSGSVTQHDPGFGLEGLILELRLDGYGFYPTSIRYYSQVKDLYRNFRSKYTNLLNAAKSQETEELRAYLRRRPVHMVALRIYSWSQAYRFSIHTDLPGSQASLHYVGGRLSVFQGSLI